MICVSSLEEFLAVPTHYEDYLIRESELREWEKIDKQIKEEK